MNKHPIEWIITETEQKQNDIQFSTLSPVGGFVTGSKVRPLFMKSGLSSAILGQIWHLADYTKDGKMDRIEFSIAMHLIRSVLAGKGLPATLPDSLKHSLVLTPQIPVDVQLTPVRAPVHHALTTALSTPVCPLNRPSQPVVQSRFQEEWTILHHNKLKYCQQFNQLDKNRVGLLAGVHARNVMAQSQLPNTVLADIWTLADVNKDGYLSVDEFCIAMHLIQSVKDGFTLPPKLPPDLLSFCIRLRTESPVLDSNASPAQRTQILKTFEDKRRDNYDKGQIELDRRRQLLQEEEERRKAEIVKREKEEAARREQEREEIERKRLQEQELELLREKERGAARLAEERRIMAEKEEARREMERQRRADLDAIRIRELKQQLGMEKENTLDCQQRQKTLSFQLQALNEKSADLYLSITQARNRIIEITKEIESMKGKRDEKVSRIAELKRMNNQFNIQCEQVAHESLQTQTECRSSVTRAKELSELQLKMQTLHTDISALHMQVQDADNRVSLQQQLVANKHVDMNSCQAKFKDSREVYLQMSSQLNQLRKEAEDLIRKSAKESPDSSADAQTNSYTSAPAASNKANHWESTNNQFESESKLPSAKMTSGAVKYRALYEFNARSDDELSFQPGDVILVFESHNSEPGWLAGQMRDKVGWFPMAFAEPIAPVGLVSTEPAQTISSLPTSPSSEPLQSIREEPLGAVVCKSSSYSAEPIKKEMSNGISQPRKEQTNGRICLAIAQYQWKARNDTELSFLKGDTIEVMEKMEMRWKGKNSSGSIGWFPKSYVKPNESVNGKPGEQETNYIVADAPETAESKQSQQNTIPMYDIVSEEQTAPTDEWCIALYDFEAVEPNDLELRAGDCILITEAVEDWWRGTCNGKSGIFPANYVQRCPAPSAISGTNELETGKVVANYEASADNQLSLKVGDFVKIKNKSLSGWWQGEVVSRDDIKKSGWFPGNYVEVIHQQSTMIAEALYDYTAQRDDELSFKAADLIIVTEHSDAEWWKGKLQQNPSSSEAMFPARFVRCRVLESTRKSSKEKCHKINEDLEQYSLSDECLSANSKQCKLIEELLESEIRFHRDLTILRDVFGRKLTSIIGQETAKRLFLNTNELIAASIELITALKRRDPGSVFMEKIDLLQVFVHFCSQQRSALDLLSELEKRDTSFRRVYHNCCERTGGLNLGYLLLLPMGRVTRYPLIFEKLLKYTSPDNPSYQELETAYHMLKATCAEIDQEIHESENAELLHWSQQYIRCDAINPPIFFPSETRSVGKRQFLHSGVLYKQRSGKLLVAILFNDFLMLCTPSESIDQVDGFKITKSTELVLNLYKFPLMIENLSIVNEKDDHSISLKYISQLTVLRAPNRNIRVLWLGQIQKAIDNFTVESTSLRRNKPCIDISGIGRLLIELTCIRNISSLVANGKDQRILCKFELGNEYITGEIDGTKDECLLTTQLSIISTDCSFRISLLCPRIYSPDVSAGTSEINFKDLVKTASSHRGPVLRQFYLDGSDLNSTDRPFAIVKFVVQLF